MKRLRSCWLEIRHRDGLKLLCVSRRPVAPNVAETWRLQPDEVVILPKSISGRLRGRLLNRVMQAVEYVRDEQLGQVLGLLREGFIVER